MAKWEYKIEHGSNVSAVQERINALGQEGWELVEATVLPLPSKEPQPEQLPARPPAPVIYAFLKRRSED